METNPIEISWTAISAIAFLLSFRRIARAFVALKVNRLPDVEPAIRYHISAGVFQAFTRSIYLFLTMCSGVVAMLTSDIRPAQLATVVLLLFAAQILILLDTILIEVFYDVAVRADTPRNDGERTP